MAQNAGSFTVDKHCTEGEVCGKGSLATLLIGFKFNVVMAAGAVGGDQPAIKFYAVNPLGESVEIGAGWLKEIQHGDQAGRRFYSITFDDPSFDKPLNVAAWPVEGQDGKFGITFSRPRQQQAAA